jgi:hypothetical protein
VDEKSGLRSGGADEVENLLMAVEWLACPVFGDFGEETMFDGVPFRSARRVVRHCEGQPEEAGELRLEFRFPDAASGRIAAEIVRERLLLNTRPICEIVY